jgi:hypothetical protein
VRRRAPGRAAQRRPSGDHPHNPPRSRTFITVVVGSIVGILGVTGWHGFLYHVATQLLVRRRRRRGPSAAQRISPAVPAAEAPPRPAGSTLLAGPCASRRACLPPPARLRAVRGAHAAQEQLPGQEVLLPDVSSALRSLA